MGVKNRLKGMGIMKRFILVVVFFTLLYNVTLTLFGILIGYYISFGIISNIFGDYFIAFILLILSPAFAFLTYILYFDYPQELVPINKFKNHVPKIHILDDYKEKNLEVK